MVGKVYCALGWFSSLPENKILPMLFQYNVYSKIDTICSCPRSFLVRCQELLGRYCDVFLVDTQSIPSLLFADIFH